MRRYYNPDMSDEATAELDWANFTVLMTAQALLGAITSNLVAVVVRTEFESSISVDLVVDALSSSDDDVVEDVVVDLGSYVSHLDSPIDVSVSVVVDSRFVLSREAPGRLVYLRRSVEPSCPSAKG